MLGYALAFAAFGAGLSVLLVLGESLPIPAAVALGAALASTHALVCRSAEHVVRVSPLRGARLSWALSTLVAAASAAGFLFAVLAAIGGAILDASLGQSIFDEAPMFFALGAGAYLVAEAYHYVGAARREASASASRALEAEVAALESELKALSAKVNPHFLFNALHSVAALTATNPAAGRAMCLDLAELMRFQLRVGEAAFVPFSEELETLRRYVAIEGVRFDDRMRVEVEIADACLTWPVPPLLVQPLVENAVKHGIAPSSEMGFVRLEAQVQGGALCVTVRNSVPADGAAARTKGGLGLDLVRRRVAAVYGGRGRFTAAAMSGFFEASLVVPGKEERS